MLNEPSAISFPAFEYRDDVLSGGVVGLRGRGNARHEQDEGERYTVFRLWTLGFSDLAGPARARA